MSVLIESMHRITVPKYVIRVWKQEAPNYTHVQSGVTELELLAHHNQDLPMHELAGLLLGGDDINAVEVLGWDGCGVVLYRNWP
jgi:hypothetical protein